MVVYQLVLYTSYSPFLSPTILKIPFTKACRVEAKNGTDITYV